MPKLDDNEKRFVARRIACRMRPATIQIEFKEEFNKTITSGQISDLNGATAHGRERLGEELTAYFWQARQEHDAEVAKTPLNDLNHRQALRWDLLMYSPQVAASPKMALEIIESGAKDAGGQFMRDAAPKKKFGVSGEEDDDGEGEGGDDDNSEAAERAAELDSVLEAGRAERDRQAAENRATGPPSLEGEAAGTDRDLPQ